MPKGLQGFQKGHKSFISQKTYKKIGGKVGKILKIKFAGRTLNTGRTHFKKGISNNALQNNPMWKGGRFQNKDGYVLVKAHGHPMTRSQGYILEHRLKMADHLGRILLKKEVVHHKNGIKNDNRIENLEILTAEKHTSLHCNKQIRFICLICHKGFNDSKNTKRKFCSMPCYRISRRGRPIFKSFSVRQ